MKALFLIVFLAVLTLFVVSLSSQEIPDYDRDNWMPSGWEDADGDGMDARHEVLRDESTIGVATNRNASMVLSGAWRDVYTGLIYTDPSDLDIDHVVALSWAHERGGFAWDEDRRRAFANDITDADHLVAVAASVNRSKGARGPADWRPPSRDAWCWYGATVVRISFRWHLTLTAADRSGLQDLLATCEP